jgi:nifR3 family TIM-barrel protein
MSTQGESELKSLWGTLPTKVQVASVLIQPNLILAPMEGVTDLTFRRLIRQIGGSGMTVTEFIAARNLRMSIDKERRMASFDDDERPIAIQLYGREPEVMADAARFVQDLGADVVDLNMGCPSKKVCAHSGGSALMKEMGLATEIVRAMRAAVTIPFTVKMRSGWDTDSKNAPAMAWMCQEEGADAVAVHWRTRTDKYGGQRELDTIAEVVHRLDIPVIANGDIVDIPSAAETMRYTGCAGLMIGRGAIRNPWLFRQLQDVMEGRNPTVVDVQERRRVLLGYFEDIRTRFRNDRGALGRFKKISRYFTEGIADGAGLRQSIFHSQSAEEAIAVVNNFFAALQAAGPISNTAQVSTPCA